MKQLKLKKILMLIFAVSALLCLAFAACGSKNVTYKVTFETNGGTSISEIICGEGETIALPTPPTKNGFEFKGWYYETNFQTEFTKDSVITKDTTVYAKWEAILTMEDLADKALSEFAGKTLSLNGTKVAEIEDTENCYRIKYSYNEESIAIEDYLNENLASLKTENENLWANGTNKLAFEVSDEMNYENTIYNEETVVYLSFYRNQTVDGAKKVLKDFCGLDLDFGVEVDDVYFYDNYGSLTLQVTAEKESFLSILNEIEEKTGSRLINNYIEGFKLVADDFEMHLNIKNNTYALYINPTIKTSEVEEDIKNLIGVELDLSNILIKSYDKKDGYVNIFGDYRGTSDNGESATISLIENLKTLLGTPTETTETSTTFAYNDFIITVSTIYSIQLTIEPKPQNVFIDNILNKYIGFGLGLSDNVKLKEISSAPGVFVFSFENNEAAKKEIKEKIDLATSVTPIGADTSTISWYTPQYEFYLVANESELTMKFHAAETVTNANAAIFEYTRLKDVIPESAIINAINYQRRLLNIDINFNEDIFKALKNKLGSALGVEGVAEDVYSYTFDTEYLKAEIYVSDTTLFLDFTSYIDNEIIDEVLKNAIGTDITLPHNLKCVNMTNEKYYQHFNFEYSEETFNNLVNAFESALSSTFTKTETDNAFNWSNDNVTISLSYYSNQITLNIKQSDEEIKHYSRVISLSSNMNIDLIAGTKIINVITINSANLLRLTIKYDETLYNNYVDYFKGLFGTGKEETLTQSNGNSKSKYWDSKTLRVALDLLTDTETVDGVTTEISKTLELHFFFFDDLKSFNKDFNLCVNGNFNFSNSEIMYRTFYKDYNGVSEFYFIQNDETVTALSTELDKVYGAHTGTDTYMTWNTNDFQINLIASKNMQAYKHEIVLKIRPIY